uniref:Uncharacterized protein n=1 Tax=OCS116 cluster bacterium TaxID=2030921 RepID=A0A2A4YWW0_9PROT
MQFTFILTGLLLLVGALARLILDGLAIFESAILRFETLSQTWQNYFPSGLKFIETYMPTALWDPYLMWVLQQPSFAVFGLAGLVFIFMSFMFRRRNKRRLSDEFL